VTTNLNAKLTFDAFVVGAANRLAVTAGKTVAENPGSAYNPLFIYSDSGLGKTHLLMATGQAARKIAPALTVEYVTLDDWVEAFHAAIAQGQGDAVRHRFQSVDLLLLDDVQFLANRKEMQAELLRLTETLLSAGHQIVLTSDRPPNEIADLDERLISRFSGGLVVDMAPPDYETRVAILRRKAEERGMTFGAGVLEAAATLEVANVRELMGALNRLVAYQAVNEAPLTPEGARQVLGAPSRPPGAAAPAAPSAAPAPPAAAAAAPTPAPEAARAAAPPAADEFDRFVSDVAVTVGRAVEAWRARVAEAVLRWEGEGYRTKRLEALLDGDAPGAVEGALAAFQHDVERLRALEREVAQLDLLAAGDAVFRDPERLAEAEAYAARVRDGVAPPPGPSPAFMLARFAEGPSNQIAVGAAREVIADPGRRYNPLVVVGRAGVGKTHLLHAIGNELARKSGAVVACLSTVGFIDELIAAIDGNRVDWWRARYRRATALLLDDVHLLVGKDRSQEELFNLFNLLMDQERQLVFTAPVHPGSLEGLEERLVSRLQGGLVVELAEPDRAVRRAVLERALDEQQLVPELALLDYLGDRPAESVRSLLDALQRVTTAAAAQDKPLTAAFAREVLEGQPSGRRTAGMRTSGIVVSSAGGVRSREKMVWEWPDPADRVIEELR
jgi:chromosomal replication initiation ATPase DnaA